ncbi:probable ADP-ribosylation factor GTPase-activating protein AGD14 isoform X1 [Rhododendron vialii]|uniref:probable ADP-ribosylation factor GTPase-activating protein AGD14 isoform X1 n=2 Tax=Rhododendron vialii TaxID=182163 RepID=UPI00265FF07C|nr:probable ADP-ribosylation factor GTPase-activating protein AGD14 isoform X1 [Rhododendron vialii]XP_058206770.1 probable ADP-ribosylation factor GTPase-activating protein AGD14 isoform X1 [Rhododendron vialii]
MANRVKEDEKNERIIRNLLKLADNRRCINCNSLGPQYVCTNFWTFVCTNCSGIHREFTHRVKSVSMAKFSSQEVTALQEGGNTRAKEIYFKECDPQRHYVTDASNVERLRDFIKHVYVDRRYTGEKSFDKPPKVKMGETEDSYESRRTDAYQGGPRSPPYEDMNERRYSDRPSPGGRSDEKNYRKGNEERKSPGYDQESRQYGDSRRSPAHTKVVNDWRREDRFGNGRRSDDGRISDGSYKLEGRSPDHQKDLQSSSPPIVRPVREILGENVSPLRIIEPPKANGGRATDGTASTQRSASSSSLASSNGNPAELRREYSGSLIDFDAVPEPPTTEIQQTQPAAVAQSVAQPTTSSNADNWASFDSPPEVKVPQAPANANSLESVLSQLSVSASVPAQTAGIFGSGGFPTTAPFASMSALPSASNSPGAAVPVNNSTNLPPVGAPVASPVGQVSMSPFVIGAPCSTSVLPSNAVNSFVQVPVQHSLFPPSSSQPTAQPFNPPVSGSSRNQPWNLSPVSDIQVPSRTAQTSPAPSKPAPEVTSEAMEVKPSGRKALPEDLFAATYPSYAMVPGWQTRPPYRLGFNMQYNTAMPMPTYPQLSKSINPFDVPNEISPVQALMFPSVASLQGALPNAAAPAGLFHSSNLGTPSPSLMPSLSSYPSAMPTHAPTSFSSAVPPPSAYMGQQVPSSFPPRKQGQGVVGFSNDAATFGSSFPNQQLGGMYSAPTVGNPFG